MAGSIYMSLPLPVDFTKYLYEDDAYSGAPTNAVLPIQFDVPTQTISIVPASDTAAGCLTAGAQNIGGVKTFYSCPKSLVAPVDGTDLARKSYVDDVVARGLSWKDEVIEFRAMNASPPPAPADGARYISNETAGGFVANRIYEWDDETSAWLEFTPEEGWALYVLQGSTYADQTIVFSSGGNWVGIGSSINHQDLIGAGTLTHATIDSYLDQAVKTTSDAVFRTIKGQENDYLPAVAPLNSQWYRLCPPVAVINLDIEFSHRPYGYSRVAYYGYSPGPSHALHVFTSQIGVFHPRAMIARTTSTGLYHLYIASANYTLAITRVCAAGYVGPISFTDCGPVASPPNDLTPGDYTILRDSSTDAAAYPSIFTGNILACNGGSAQIALKYDPAGALATTFATDAAGDLTVDATGNDINLHSTDTVRVLNTTASTSTTTGALIVSGGAGFAAAVYAQSLNGRGPAAQLVLSRPNVVPQFTATVGVDGTCTLDTSGDTLILHSTDKLRISNTTLATSPTSAALVVAGGIGSGDSIYAAGSLQLTTAAARVQFVNADTKRRVVLYAAADNDFQYHGIGTAPSEFRSQIATTASRFGFYSATSASSDQELVRIEGSLTANPAVRIFATTAATSATTGALAVGGGIGAVGSVYGGADLRLTAASSRVQFSNSETKRRIVLWEAAANDYEFFGQGIQPNEYRMQLGTTAARFGFYSATGSTADQELMRISGSLTANPAVRIFSTTNSSSTSTGALVVNGGGAFASDLRVGGTIYGNVSGSIAAPLTLTRAGGEQLTLAYDGTNTCTFTVNSSGTLAIAPYSGDARISANLLVGSGAGDYRRIQMSGGNSDGTIFTSYPAYPDTINLSFNYYANPAGTGIIPNSGGGTSMISAGYSSVSILAGAVNTTPTSRLVITNTAISATLPSSITSTVTPQFEIINSGVNKASMSVDGSGNLAVAATNYASWSSTGTVSASVYSATNVAIRARRIGNLVTVELDTFSATSGGTASEILLFSTNVPSLYRPTSSTTAALVVVYDGDGLYPGSIEIDVNGNVNIFSFRNKTGYFTLASGNLAGMYRAGTITFTV